MKYLFVFIALFVFFEPLSAQQSDTAPEEAVSTDSTQATEEVEQTINQPAEQGDFDVFRPTEDISEDLAVPFPVDI